MKQLLICACVAMMGMSVLTSKADDAEWGAADTVACHMIGPGMKYTKIIYHKLPAILWWTEIDLKNEWNKVEQVQSRHKVPDVQRWDVMTHYKENSRPGHQVKVAWNHDFFSYDDGVCIGMNVSEGEMTWNLWGRSLLAITKDKKAEVFNPNNVECRVTAADGTSVSIDSYNSSALYLRGDCIFFNRMNSQTLTEAGRYIKLLPKGEWLVNGADIPCEVVAVGDEPQQTSATECVLYLRNAKLNAFDSHVKVGDVVNVTQRFNGAAWGAPPADIVNAFHGYPSLAHDGVLHDGEYNNFESGREYEKSSHVLVGISKDKTKMYVLLNEMSANSQALDCVEMTKWMLARGAWDVVNFDSGGSAAIVVDGDMLNLPGRGSVRPVEDAMLALSLAPEDNNIDHMTFSKPHITPSTISLTPLRVVGFNKYDEIIEQEVKDCSYSCEPSALGSVDAEGVFHSGAVGMSGKIIAEKGGRKAEILVDTRTAEDVSPKVTNILINSVREYLIPVTGTCDGETFSLDAAAFEWQNTNTECCSVEDGVLRGLKNGSAVVTGKFGDLSFDINVKVEIPERNTVVVDDLTDVASLGLVMSGVKNVAVDAAQRPEGWSEGVTCSFDISGSRAPSFKFTTPHLLYGLPDSITLHLRNEGRIVKQVSVNYSDALGESGSRTFEMPENEDEVLSLPFKEGDGTPFDVVRYPITVTRLTFTLQSSKAGSGYKIGLGEYVAHYSEGTSAVATVERDDSALRLTVGAETVEAAFVSAKAGKAVVNMYSTSGQVVYSEAVEVEAGENVVLINTKAASCGLYIVSINDGERNQVGKCIIR